VLSGCFFLFSVVFGDLVLWVFCVVFERHWVFRFWIQKSEKVG
jgi:hypothetical protein